MRRQVEVYAEWPDHLAGMGRWRCGSGYLLGGRLVLTAAHVVCPHGRALATVRVRVESELVAAEVAWYRCAGEVDVALLVVTESAWVPPVWPQPVRWGRLVTSRAGQGCEALGFPSVVAEPRRRDTHRAVGVLNPGSLVKAGRYAMEVSNPPARPAEGGSRWAGMSGAAVLSEGLIVGVVTADPVGFDSRRLVAVPITSTAEDPDFHRLVVQHCGRAPLVEAVELVGLAERAPTPSSPAGLLRADAGHTPFRSRPELDRLHEWCRSSEWNSTRLVVGPGGQGKTRLARRLAGELDAAGWATVVLAERAKDVGVLGEVAVPTLVVVDYVEGRTDQLGAVVEALAGAQAKTRLLLLSRTAGSWRTDRVDPSPHLEVLADDRIVVELGSLEPTLGGRAEAWEQAAAELARPLGELDGYRGIDWGTLVAGLARPRLAGSRYGTILAVQMHALAALLQAGAPVPAAGERPEQVLLAHEARYWRRVANRFDINLTAKNQRYLVTAAALWCAADENEAGRVVAATGLGADRNAVSNIVDWLATLYNDGQRYWSGVQPDAIAEYLIGTCAHYPELVNATVGAVSPSQLEHGLSLLGRAYPRHLDLADTIIAAVLRAGEDGAVAAITVAPQLEQPQPLLTALEWLIPAATPATLWALARALPDRSLVLASMNLRITEALTARLHRAAVSERELYIPDLATAMINLGYRLDEVGRVAEGLVAGQEAVTVCRDLVLSDRTEYLPLLVASLRHAAESLARNGRLNEGLAVAREAVELGRELVADDRSRHLPELARALRCFADRLCEVDRETEGVTVAQDAVELHRELVAKDRNTYLPALASALNSLVVGLGGLDRWVEGLVVAQEVVELRRELAEGNRDAYLSGLASSLTNLTVFLGNLGQRTESVAAAREAVELYRRVVATNRKAHLPELVKSLINFGNRLRETRQLAEGLAAAQEAVELCHELVGDNRHAYLPELALAVHAVATQLADADSPADALAATQQAVQLWRELVADNRGAYLRSLAQSMENLASFYFWVGRRDDGLAASREVVDLYRELAANGS